MSDVELTLSAMLVDRAERIEPQHGHRERTLGRARRRRIVNAVTAGVVSLAVVAGGVGAVQALDTAPAVRPAAPEGPGRTFATAGDYGFWSRNGTEYPYVATGFFRSAEWQLRAAAVSFAPDAYTRLTLQIRMRGSELGASTGLKSVDEGIFVNYHPGGEWAFDGDVAMVFGAAPPGAETVDVLVERNGADPQRIEAHVYEGYDARTPLVADYYLAFVPAGAAGRVVAHDDEGREVDEAVIPTR
jgi:hypothetical protein